MAKQKIKCNQIRTITQLKKFSKNGLNCYILLNGNLRSSKHISYCADKNRFLIFNLIDGSEQELTESQIFDSKHSNIGEAMKKGCLITD